MCLIWVQPTFTIKNSIFFPENAFISYDPSNKQGLFPYEKLADSILQCILIVFSISTISLYIVPLYCELLIMDSGH